MKAGRDVRLAADPLGIVGRGAGKRAIEKDLSEAADVDHNAQGALDGKDAQMAAQPPCCFLIEGTELKLFFLRLDAGEIIGDGHDGVV